MIDGRKKQPAVNPSKGVDQLPGSVGGTVEQSSTRTISFSISMERARRVSRFVEYRSDYRDSVKTIFILLQIAPIHS